VSERLNFLVRVTALVGLCVSVRSDGLVMCTDGCNADYCNQIVFSSVACSLFFLLIAPCFFWLTLEMHRCVCCRYLSI